MAEGFPQPGGDATWTVIGAPGAPALQGAWAAGAPQFGAPRFRKAGSNMVYLQGYLVSGIGGTTAFTLPPGYRPSVQTILATVTGALGTSADYTKVLPDGSVQPPSGGANGDIINCSFIAEQ